MIKRSELPDTIAIFPLSGALLLPRSRLPLIGMVQPNVVPGRSGPGLQTIGCAGRITQFSETEDGRYMITLGGVSRFRVIKEIEGFTPYRRCDVNWGGFERDLGSDEKDTWFDRKNFLNTLGRYFDARNLSADWDTLQEADDELLINSLSMMLDLESEDKQALLEAPSLATRRETLLTLIEYTLRGGNEGEMMN